MNDILSLIREGGYLPIPEIPNDIYFRLSRSKITNKIPQSPVGIHYLDNIFSHRYKARTLDNTSFHDAFYDDFHLLKVIDYVHGTGRIPDKELVLKNLKFLVKTPAHFFPDSSAALCNEFGSRRKVYDMFTGWGGRSLGAICSNASWLVSTDLQKESTNSGLEMAKDFRNLSKTKCEFINVDFKNYVDGTNEKFDFIIASPPFLNSEDYGVKSDDTVRGWVQSILIPMVSGCKRVLEENGRIAIHGQDRPNSPVLSFIYSSFICSGFSLFKEYKYGKKSGQSVLVFTR